MDLCHDSLLFFVYMRIFVFSVIAALGGGITLSLAETLSRGSSQSNTAHHGVVSSSLQPSSEQIIDELKCGVIFTLDSPEKSMDRVEGLGRELAGIWETLAERGFPYPSENDRAHFYAQILYESKNLQWLSELDPSKSKIKNAQKWRGRGPIQLSHCKNYAAFAWFMKNLDANKRGNELFRETPGLHSETCPPKSVQDSIIMVEPEISLGNSPLGGYRMSAYSAVWWWQERKLRSSSFRNAIESGDEKSVSVVTKLVKGSTETQEKRSEKFLTVKRCIANSKRHFSK